jgi:hypothetical protein
MGRAAPRQFSDTDALVIRAASRSVPPKYLAAAFGTTRQTVEKILKRETYRLHPRALPRTRLVFDARPVHWDDSIDRARVPLAQFPENFSEFVLWWGEDSCGVRRIERIDPHGEPVIARNGTEYDAGARRIAALFEPYIDAYRLNRALAADWLPTATAREIESFREYEREVARDAKDHKAMLKERFSPDNPAEQDRRRRIGETSSRTRRERKAARILAEEGPEAEAIYRMNHARYRARKAGLLHDYPRPLLFNEQEAEELEFTSMCLPLGRDLDGCIERPVSALKPVEALEITPLKRALWEHARKQAELAATVEGTDGTSAPPLS